MSSKTKRQFVIQAHDATNMHYDFRLEIDGVLESWAVPKGPSTDPSEKRLAIRTNPHPIDHGDFEGVIPEGEEGAGPVQIWDKGTYTNIKEEDGHEVAMGKCLDDGHITVWLEGQKLNGGYALTRAESLDPDSGWLLVKMDDDEADARRNPVNTETESVKSGKTLAAIVRDAS